MECLGYPDAFRHPLINFLNMGIAEVRVVVTRVNHRDRGGETGEEIHGESGDSGQRYRENHGVDPGRRTEDVCRLRPDRRGKILHRVRSAGIRDPHRVAGSRELLRECPADISNTDDADFHDDVSAFSVDQDSILTPIGKFRELGIFTDPKALPKS